MSKILFISKKCEEYRGFIKFALENGIELEILREYDNNKIHELNNFNLDLIITEDMINNARYLSRILEDIPVICISNQDNNQNFKELNHICTEEEFKEHYIRILKENKIRFFKKNNNKKTDSNTEEKESKESKNVLIISDDNEEIVELEELVIKYFLVKSFNSSFKFKIHSNNINADNRPILIIINLNMLLKNDLDVANRIISIKSQYNVPIWVTTSKIDKDALIALSKFSISECIIRPFDINTIQGKLKQIK